jgi:hypothetical protein
VILNDAAGFASCCGPVGCPPRTGGGLPPPRHRDLARRRECCYRGPWHLPGPDSHRLAAVSLSLGYVVVLLLICAGTPGQQRVRVDGDLLLAAGRMDGAEPGSTVERPQRSEDERPGRRRGPSQDQHSESRIPGQRIGTTSEQATGGAAMAGVRGRPALSWSAGRWPGDVMIDGVSHRVRPLVLSGPASVAWRQEHCGSWPRRISGVGRARTSRIGQATRPRSGVSDGGA